MSSVTDLWAMTLKYQKALNVANSQRIEGKPMVGVGNIKEEIICVLGHFVVVFTYLHTLV